MPSLIRFRQHGAATGPHFLTVPIRNAGTIDRDRGASRFGRVGIVVSLALFLAGCTTYEPRPLDMGATLDAWKHRVAALESPETRDAASRPSTFDAKDGVDLGEAERIALVFNGELRVARAELAIRSVVAEHSGTWDDPVLGADFERVVSNAGGISPTVLRPTLSVTLPISGRLGLLRAAADADARVELTRVAALEWDVRSRTRRAWFEWAGAAARVALMKTAVESVEAWASVAARQAEAGVLTGLEARLFTLEGTLLRMDLAQAVDAEREADARLRELIGLAPAPEPRFVFDGWKADENRHGEDWKKRNLEIALRSADYEAAERRLELEVRRQYPDLTIGPGFGTDRGERRLLFDVSIPIPLWNANAGPIAEAEAVREAARIRFDVECESVGSKVATAAAAAVSATRRRRAIEESVIPLADAQLADVGRMADLGRMEPVIALQAVKTRHEAALRLIDARIAEASAADLLRRWIGPSDAGRADAPSDQGIGDERR